MLNASQNLTNLAALTDALISKHPANSVGWLATIPTVRPSNLPNPIIISKIININKLYCI